MRICFFSDIHGNTYAFQAFWKDLEKKGSLDLVIFGGDVFGYFYGANEIITELRKRKVHCLLGNHDRMFLDIVEGKRTADRLCGKYGSTYRGIERRISEENISFLSSLKSEYRMEADNTKMAFVHGSVADPLNGRIYPDTEVREEDCDGLDVIFMGHTHHKMLRSAGNCLLVNPGSVGQPRDGKGTSYVIYDTEKKECEFCVFPYDYSRLLADIEVNEKGNEAMEEKLKELVTRVR